MKKISIILIMIVAFASCTKENSVNTTGKTGLNTNTKAAAQPVMRFWFDNGGSDFGCKEGKGNCLPTTEIVGEKINPTFQSSKNKC